MGLFSMTNAEAAMPSRDSIIDRIKKLESLPMLSSTMEEIRLAALGNSPDLNKLIKVIERDIGMSGRILKIANSVFYSGRYGEIGTVRQAVVRMGLQETCRVCLAAGCLDLFPKVSPLINIKDFWFHSLSVAITARMLAERTESGVRETIDGAYIAGLFHDTGILILDLFLHDIYKKVRDEAVGWEGNIFELERKMLGIDHGEIGAMLLERWNFPESIIRAVSCHHQPEKCPQDTRILCDLIHLADFGCASLGAMEPGEMVQHSCNPGAWTDLKISPDDFADIIKEIEVSFEKSKIFVGTNAEA
jgi:HD-like signal output (HDOD) protein